MTEAEPLKAAEKARAKGGLAMFLCPYRPGGLRITPATCAQQHKAAQHAVDEALIRLWDCRDCPVGAGNLAAAPTAPLQRRERLASYRRGGEASKPSTAMRDDALLTWLRERGRATSRDAALHFGRSRDTMADRLAALERAGKIKRFQGQSRTLIWEAL